MASTEPILEAPAAQVSDTTWYHTIELPGSVVTPGYFDTVTALSRIPFPESLAGQRCLDVGTSDGFWAFEMERRGASEVIAVDVGDAAHYDWPEPRPEVARLPAKPNQGANAGFEIAHAALGSNVEWTEMSVYEISPERLGEFDFVFMGSLMLHLRDPVQALRAVRSVVRGEFLSADSISLATTVTHPRIAAASLGADGEPRWWTPNLVAYRRLLAAAGLRITRAGGIYLMPFGKGFAMPRLFRDRGLRGLRPSEVFFRLVVARMGAPGSWALCQRD
jgi:tRNA (mo5U34)-methyltransferase